jgi:hypothetical protein
LDPVVVAKSQKTSVAVTEDPCPPEGDFEEIEVEAAKAKTTQLGGSTQAAPTCGGELIVGCGCGISMSCPSGYPPPAQSIGAGVIDACPA